MSDSTPTITHDPNATAPGTGGGIPPAPADPSTETPASDYSPMASTNPGGIPPAPGDKAAETATTETKTKEPTESERRVMELEAELAVTNAKLKQQGLDPLSNYNNQMGRLGQQYGDQNLAGLIAAEEQKVRQQHKDISDELAKELATERVKGRAAADAIRATDQFQQDYSQLQEQERVQKSRIALGSYFPEGKLPPDFEGYNASQLDAALIAFKKSELLSGKRPDGTLPRRVLARKRSLRIQ